MTKIINLEQEELELKQKPYIYETKEPPCLPVRTVNVACRKSARGQIRNSYIEIVVPANWPGFYKKDISIKLARCIQNQFNRDWEMLHQSPELKLSFTGSDMFSAWVDEINQSTVKAPLKGVKIGNSKYTRLAQMNLKTAMMTVSKYCLNEVPFSALRYLVIHELTHLYIPNHSRLFWQKLSYFVPDYRYQRRIISATHCIRVYQAEQQADKGM